MARADTRPDALVAAVTLTESLPSLPDEVVFGKMRYPYSPRAAFAQTCEHV